MLPPEFPRVDIMRIASLALAILCLPGLALAAAAPKVDQAPAVKAVVDCRKITDSTQRLACFDAAVANLDDAQAKGDVVTMDRAQRQSLRKETFGFALPSLAIFDKGASKEEVSNLTLKVTRVSHDAQGHWLITLEGDQLWRQTDSEVLARDPRPGSTALIQKGALGSFTMKLDGQPTIKVHRDQ